MKKRKGSVNRVMAKKGKETLRRLIPTRKIQKRGKNEEMRRKREELKKCMNINNPRQS